MKHLLGLQGVPEEEIYAILDTAKSFRELRDRPVKKVPSLRGTTIVNLFFENSTRTRISFELAEKRLSADLINFTSSGSSISKGETLLDTVHNIESMKIDLVVVRHSGAGVPAFLAKNTHAIVLNAGDGAHEHPTQALLDMFTMRQRFGEIKGLRVAIVGDIRFSRVARSNAWGLKTLGADVVFCGPPTLMPGDMSDLGVEIAPNLEQAVRGADVVMALRVQRERQNDGYLASEREYRACYGITRERLDAWNPSAMVMHPGPVNRNIELDSEVADSEQSVILDQVTNGVAVRMAALYLLAGGIGK